MFTRLSKHRLPLILAVLLFLSLPASAITTHPRPSGKKNFALIMVRLGDTVFIEPEANILSVENNIFQKQRTIFFKKNSSQPLTVHVTDFFGVRTSYDFESSEKLDRWRIPEKISPSPTPNPQKLLAAPILCPRLGFVKNKDGNPIALYKTSTDLLNRSPILQNFDVNWQKSLSSLRSFVKARTLPVGGQKLMIRRASIRYDYEDEKIIDYAGPSPENFPLITYEGQGGFYANFHIAAIPYKPAYEKLSPQDILKLAQGLKTSAVLEKPKQRTHSFLPGPYLAKQGSYNQCEWGDTAVQAPLQTLSYQDFPIWHWEQNKAPLQQEVLIIVWEGDEEDTAIREFRIPSNYITDDLVAVFRVRHADTKTERVYQNPEKNFSITLMTR